MKISQVLKYYKKHISRYKKTVSLTFVSYGFAVILAHFIEPIIYKEIIDKMSGSFSSNLLADDLMLLFIFLVLTVLAYNIFFRIGDWAIVYSQSGALRLISVDAFSRLQKHSYEFFTNNFAGSLVTKVKRFVRSFESIYDKIVYALWFDGIKLIVALIAMWIFIPQVLPFFIFWFISFVAIVYFLSKKQYSLDYKRSVAESKTTGFLADAITNVLNIKMFSALSSEKKIFKSVAKEEQLARERSWYFGNIQHMFLGLYVAVFELIVMYMAIRLWIDGAVSSGVIVLVQMYIYKTAEIVWNMGRNMRQIMQSFADAEEMVEIFEAKPTILDPKNPEFCKINEGEIEIKNIDFAYVKGRNVFEGLSLRIKAGERVALVGHSGSGKSTITKLLLRFADVQSGEILIDGQNIANIRQDDLRAKISYVPQEPLLFHRSLAENISYAKPDADISEIKEIAKKAHAHEFIKNLEDAYDTLVGERGVKLSGGERQRVAIARAMLKDAPILILDEATSALDSISEKHIQAAFNTLMEGRTTLVIAHRLSTIEKMDRIIVFDNGSIIEEGTHKELLDKRGEYYKFWKEQNNGLIVNNY